MRLLGKGVGIALLCVYIVIVVFPLAWMGMNSFKTTAEIHMSPWSLPAAFGERKEQLASAADEIRAVIADLPESVPSTPTEQRALAETFRELTEEPEVEGFGEEMIILSLGGPAQVLKLLAPELPLVGDTVNTAVAMGQKLDTHASDIESGTNQSSGLSRRLPNEYKDVREDLVVLADAATAKVAQGAFGNYVEAWTTTGIGPAFLNSLMVTAATMLVLIPIAAMAAYVLAKYKFRGSNALFMLFLGGMMFPQFLVIVPLFLQMSSMGLDDNLFGLTLVYIAFSLPFTVFVLTGFFHQLPDELAEAAMLDGCGHQKTFWKIMLPLAKPGLVVVVIFDIIGLWNEYNLSLILMQSPENYTLPKALDKLQMSAMYLGDTGALMAAMVIVILPVLIVYWLLKEKIHEAMLAGAIKG